MSDLFGGALFHAFNQLFTAFSSLAQAQHSLPAAILNSWKVHAALNIEVQKSQRTIDKGEAEHQKNKTLLRRVPWGRLHSSAQGWNLDSGHPLRIFLPVLNQIPMRVFFFFKRTPSPLFRPGLEHNNNFPKWFLAGNFKMLGLKYKMLFEFALSLAG